MGAKSGKIPGASQPQALKQLRVQQSAFGSAIPLVYGEHRLAGNILWADFFRAEENTLSASGGKGGGGEFISFVYYVACIIGLAEGPSFQWEHFNLGRAIPGKQPTSVGEQGREKPQPAAGFEPAVWKVKRVRAAGPDPPGPFKGTRFYKWHEGEGGDFDFPVPPSETATHAANGGVYVTNFGGLNGSHDIVANFLNSRPAKKAALIAAEQDEFYPGLAVVANPDMYLAGQASIPNFNFPLRALCQYVDRYGLVAAWSEDAEDDEEWPIYDADPSDVTLDLLTNEKHGAGWGHGTPFTILNGAVTNSATTITVDDTSEFPSSGKLVIEQEIVTYTGKTGTTFTGVVRGQHGSTARAHTDNTRIRRFPNYLSDWWITGNGWSDYCRANEILISPIYDAQRPLSEMLEDLARVGNAAIVWSEGTLKMIPYGDQEVTGPRTGVTFEPSTGDLDTSHGANIAVRANLTLDDFLPRKNGPVEVERQSVTPDHGSAGLFNHVRVEFENRSNGYSVEVVEAKDEASIAAHGLLSHEPFVMHEICEPGLAVDTAVRLLQRLATVRNTYRFTLGWQHVLLEPMDLVTLTEPGLGLDEFPVRIVSITEDKKGDLEVEAEEYPLAFQPYTPVGPPVDVASTVNQGVTGGGSFSEPDDGLYGDAASSGQMPPWPLGCLFSAVDGTHASPFSSPDQISAPVPVDITATSLAVRVFKASDFHDPPAQGWVMRFQLWVVPPDSDVTQGALERGLIVDFNKNECPSYQPAGWGVGTPGEIIQTDAVVSKVEIGRVRLLAGSRFCIANYPHDGTGAPLTIAGVAAVAMTFTATVGWNEE